MPEGAGDHGFVFYIVFHKLQEAGRCHAHKTPQAVVHDFFFFLFF